LLISPKITRKGVRANTYSRHAPNAACLLAASLNTCTKNIIWHKSNECRFNSLFNKQQRHHKPNKKRIASHSRFM